MARRKKDTLDKGGFAFLGTQQRKFVVIIMALALLSILAKYCDYRFLVVQKSIQDGEYKDWNVYLTLMVISVGFGCFLEVVKMMFVVWTSKTQKLNFFEIFNGLIQQDGRLADCMLHLGFANAKVTVIIGSASSIIAAIYTVITMGIVKMTIPQYIGGALILFFGFICGWIRGLLQQQTEKVGSEISAMQTILSTAYMVSNEILVERIKDIDRLFCSQIVWQGIKNTLRILPQLIKLVIYISFMWDFCSTFDGVYSYTQIVLTVYSGIVDVSDKLGYVLEDISKIIKYHKEPGICASKYEFAQKEKELVEQKKNISITKGGITIKSSFTADVVRESGGTGYYFLPQDLKLPKGKIVLVEGENGTGKSRINRLLKEIVPETLGYDVKTNIMSKYIENFRCNSEIDAALIMRLASGLGVKRVPQNEERLYKMNIKNALNGADRQLLIAIQILYFAIKNSQTNPNGCQLVILDEILANVSEKNAPKVMAFIKKELSKIGACCIIVSHAHSEVVHEYADFTWKMTNDGDKIIIAQD